MSLISVSSRQFRHYAYRHSLLLVSHVTVPIGCCFIYELLSMVLET